MGNIFILIIFWMLINTDNVFFRLLRYLIVIYGTSQIWGDLKSFEIGSAFIQIIYILVLFSPKILFRIGELRKNKINTSM